MAEYKAGATPARALTINKPAPVRKKIELNMRPPNGGWLIASSPMVYRCGGRFQRKVEPRSETCPRENRNGKDRPEPIGRILIGRSEAKMKTALHVVN